jgi:hypothetical protein
MKRFLIAIVIFISLDNFATTFEYTWRNSLANSSNVTQLPSGDAGNIFTSGFIFFVESENLQEWEFSLNGELSRIWYTGQGVIDEDRPSLATVASYNSASSNFSLNFIADVSQSPINRFQTQEVNNFRDTFLYAVSPNYFFNITDSTKLNFNYQHASYDINTESLAETFQNTPRLEQQLSVSLETLINSSNRFALVSRKKDTDFNTTRENIAVDFFQYDILGRWIVSNVTNQLLVEAGKVRIDSYGENSTEDNQWRIMFSRQLNRYQSLNIQYSKSIASLFTINQATGNIIINQQNNAISNAQVSKGGGLQYAINNGQVSLTIGVLENDLYGLFDTSFEIRRQKSLRMSYSLSRLMMSPLPRNLSIFLSENESDFDLSVTNVQENIIKIHSISYSQTLSPNFIVFFDYSKRKALRDFINLPNEVTLSETFSIGFEYRSNGRF